jgi:exopolysaccharide biosynthesis polyprenyl glycosylphosphotransferase
MIAADAVAICLTYVLADMLRCYLWMRTDWPELIGGQISSVRIHLKVLALLPICWPLILHRLGWYERRWRSWRWVGYTALVATAILGLLMAALALLFERELYPRAQIGFVGLLLPATTLAMRGISALSGQWIGARHRRQVLIVGTGREAVRLRRLLGAASVGRPKVLGHLRGPWETDPARTEAGAIVGDIDQLGPMLDEQVVDEVIFSAPLEELPTILPYVRLCEQVGVTAHVEAESMACQSVPEMTEFHGLSLLTYTPARHTPELLSIKRAVDVVVAIIGIVLTAPIMVVCALLIKLTSRGPVFFRQCRSGLNGREFAMYKFRTMDADAEEKRASVEHLNRARGPIFKIFEDQTDPRITKIGGFLRCWSLDELPQLFNVLMGDMSVVGPRPPLPAEVKEYDRWQRRRLSMRPGLTCLWQIKGRHLLGFDEGMQLDLFYIDHWSLKMDFLIMCRTVSAVLAGTGV